MHEEASKSSLGSPIPALEPASAVLGLGASECPVAGHFDLPGLRPDAPTQASVFEPLRDSSAGGVLFAFSAVRALRTKFHPTTGRREQAVEHSNTQVSEQDLTILNLREHLKSNQRIRLRPLVEFPRGNKAARTRQ